MSQFSQKLGGPEIALDRIVDQQPQRALWPNSKAALVTYDMTRTTAGKAVHYRAVAKIEVDPLLQGSFMFGSTELCAPVETFDRDLPTMFAITSIRLPEWTPICRSKPKFNWRRPAPHVGSGRHAARGAGGRRREHPPIVARRPPPR